MRTHECSYKGALTIAIDWAYDLVKENSKLRTDEMVKEIERLRSEVAYAGKKEKAYRDQLDKCYEEIRVLLCDCYSCASNYSNGENLHRQEIVNRLAQLGYEPVPKATNSDMYEPQYRGITDQSSPQTGLIG